MVAIYADCADLGQMESLASDSRIAGFTTNPTLMRRAGVKDYRAFAKTVLGIVAGKDVSFEVLSDDFRQMESQARTIADWGENVYVKIPITDTNGRLTIPLLKRVTSLKLNVTAVMTHEQVDALAQIDEEHHIVSVFAGRIADTGADPAEVIGSARTLWSKVLWASTREVGSVLEAETLGCDYITLTPDLIAKLPLLGRDLAEYSLATVRQFYEDGKGIAF